MHLESECSRGLQCLRFGGRSAADNDNTSHWAPRWESHPEQQNNVPKGLWMLDQMSECAFGTYFGTKCGASLIYLLKVWVQGLIKTFFKILGF